MKTNFAVPKLKTVFLVVSLLEVALWLMRNSHRTLVCLGLPLGAVLFGLYLIVSVLEKETALYDLEQQAKPQASSPVSIGRNSQSVAGSGRTSAPGLTYHDHSGL